MKTIQEIWNRFVDTNEMVNLGMFRYFDLLIACIAMPRMQVAMCSPIILAPDNGFHCSTDIKTVIAVEGINFSNLLEFTL